MIGIFLKHWIYEHCIELIFLGFQRNFKIPKCNHWGIRMGDRIPYIFVGKDGVDVMRCVACDIIYISPDQTILGFNARILFEYKRDNTFRRSNVRVYERLSNITKVIS